MLSSHLVSVSQTTTSPLILRACTSASVNILRPAKPTSTCSRDTQQTRGFRFGAWSSYLDPNFEKEVKRRHRLMRYKYLDSLNRRLAWDHEPSKLFKHFGKGFMCSAWRSQDARPGGRWVDMDRLDSFKHDSDSLANHGDFWKRIKIHHGVLHDLRRVKDELYSQFMGANEVGAARKSKAEDKTERKSSSKYSSGSRTSQDYEIDPITNRKVYRNSSVGTAKDGPVDIPVKTFRGYRSQFQAFVPPETMFPGYRSKFRITMPPGAMSTQAELENYDKPFMYNEPDGKSPENPDPVEQGLRDYDSSNDGYKAFRFQEPDGKLPPRPDPLQESLKDYDGEGYRPFYHNEPDGKLPENPDPVEKGLKDYDECTSYTAFRYREPDGKLPEEPDAVQESLKDYDEHTSYGSFRYNEPDGKPPAEKDSVRESLKDYDSTTSYAAFRFNEPDGKFPECADSSREALKAYDVKQEKMTQTSRPVESKLYEGYQQSRSYPSRTLYSGDKDTREDLDLLRASDIRAASGISKRSKNESAEAKSVKRQQLEKAFHESQENAVAYANETVAARQANRESATDFTTDAQKIRDGVYDRINAKMTNMESPLLDLLKREKLTGNFVRDFPEEFETSWTVKNEGSGVLTPKMSTESKKDNSSTILNSTGRANSPRLQTSLDRTSKNVGAKTTKVPAESDPYSKAPQGLEISYKNECAELGIGGPSVYCTSYGDVKKGSEKDKELIKEVRNIYEDTYGVIDSKHRQVAENDAKLDQAPTETANKNPEPTLYKILAYDPTMQSISIAETTSIVTDSASALTPAESNIDVRREEAVFSGKSSWNETATPKTKKGGKVKRVLLGGAIVGGGSYAVGVVSEFFRTGGMDGKGPQGF
ncbi:conserved serine-threonine rich protein [Rutstroemia sp. NJR-2017a WRK4]|nr:conserved serine-threonine rich protein [Rutstroemia sp. NJR-2017a WRK4]